MYPASVLLIWGIQIISIAESSDPTSYAFYGSWCIAGTVEVVLLILRLLDCPPQSTVEIAELITQLLRICVLGSLLALTYSFSRVSAPEECVEIERQPLLGIEINSHEDLQLPTASQSDNDQSADYGTVRRTTTIGSSVDNHHTETGDSASASHVRGRRQWREVANKCAVSFHLSEEHLL